MSLVVAAMQQCWPVAMILIEMLTQLAHVHSETAAVLKVVENHFVAFLWLAVASFPAQRVALHPFTLLQEETERKLSGN